MSRKEIVTICMNPQLAFYNKDEDETFVDDICHLILSTRGNLHHNCFIFVRDRHIDKDYKDSFEENLRPIHCRREDEDYMPIPQIKDNINPDEDFVIEKDTPVSPELCNFLADINDTLECAYGLTAIRLMGYNALEDILPNALLLRSLFPYAKIEILSNLSKVNNTEEKEMISNICKNAGIDYNPSSFAD